jgi:hypothetical protein
VKKEKNPMATWSERANNDMAENARNYTGQQRSALMGQISQWANNVVARSSQLFNDPKFRDHKVEAIAENREILSLTFGLN